MVVKQHHMTAPVTKVLYLLMSSRPVISLPGDSAHLSSPSVADSRCPQARAQRAPNTFSPLGELINDINTGKCGPLCQYKY